MTTRAPLDRTPRSTTLRRSPLFVERETYRRRRLRDAVGLMPFVGTFLFMVPLLWPHGPEAFSTSWAIFYIFGVWLGMAVLTGVVSSQLRRVRPTARDDET
ncbi:MAG: hypothetical protein ACPGFC_01370 [Paracoccaceae bacterium]